jgi:pimeloyl-ACP methyl ester carboxylesterase
LRFIAPDRPGYGLTPPDTNPSLATRALWLERVANAAGLERFAILGISGGAPYAVALAGRIGSRALALALVSPMGPVADLVASGPEGKAQVPFLQRRFFLHLPRRWVFPPLARLLARAFAASPSGFSGLAPRLAGDPDAAILRKSHVREAMLAMTREAVRTGAEGGIADLGIYAAPWGVDFAAISAPARVWQGTADRIVPVAAAMRLAARIPGCTLERIEGAGHFWVFERMDEICRALKRMAVAAPPSQQSASRSAT